MLDHSDYVVQGRGTEVIQDLIQFVQEKRDLDKIEEIKRVWYRDNSGEKKFTGFPKREGFDNLPDLSQALREIDLTNYNFLSSSFPNETSFQLVTSIGCPNRCHFCSYHTIRPSSQIEFWINGRRPHLLMFKRT